ncbi:MAG: TRAP transporter large permease [Lachnospiraceae bacterium]|nr:TRAP transporter large permease [Lachnospiraceae bacterium]
MSPAIGYLITLIVFIILIVSGVHIHGVLLGTGIVGILTLGSGKIITSFMGMQSFPSVASYSLSTIPMYILCAQFILQAGIVDDLYNVIFNVSRGKRSLLGTVTLILGAFLGAVCGSGMATSSALANAAYPQLTKHGYNKNHAAALAAASGSLSSIIPPSTVIIVYGVVTETSISKLFVAAVLPGCLITLVYIFCNIIMLKVDKNKEAEEETFEPIHLDKRKTMVSLLCGVLIAVTIFGGIYSGIFTPTEAGAMAAFIGFLAALILRKLNFEFIRKAGIETLKVSAMIMVIIIGAKIFGRYISMSGLAKAFVGVVEPLMDTPALLLFIVVLIYFVFFMFLEGTAVIVMTTPVLIPMVTEMGYDTIWFGVLVCMCCVIGMLTPPVGLCVYSVCGITKLPMEKVFKYGMIMAFAAAVIAGGLMILWPDLALLLPRMMK